MTPSPPALFSMYQKGITSSSICPLQYMKGPNSASSAHKKLFCAATRCLVPSIHGETKHSLQQHEAIHRDWLRAARSSAGPSDFQRGWVLLSGSHCSNAIMSSQLLLGQGVVDWNLPQDGQAPRTTTGVALQSNALLKADILSFSPLRLMVKICKLMLRWMGTFS